MKRQLIPVQIEKDNEIHKFESLSSCAKFLVCQTGQVTMNPTYKGWKITILGERTKMKDLKRKIFLFEGTGEFIQEFESLHECARHFKVKANQFFSYIQRGKYKNFILSYSKENENTFDLNDFN